MTIRNRKRQPVRISELMTSLIGELGIEKKVAEATACQIWNEVVGNSLSQVTEAVSIKRGRLFVTVINPSWRNEVMFLKREIISKLNKRIGKPTVTDIVFL